MKKRDIIFVILFLLLFAVGCANEQKNLISETTNESYESYAEPENQIPEIQTAEELDLMLIITPEKSTNFNNVRLGDSSEEYSFLLENLNNNFIYLLDWKLSGENADEFKLIPTDAQNLPENSRGEFKVQFIPKSSGNKEAIIEVIFNTLNQDEGSQTVSLKLTADPNPWNYLGEAGFSPAQAATFPKAMNNGNSAERTLSLAADNSIVYVAFKDGAQLSDSSNVESGKISVMKYVDDKWTYLGKAGFSQGQVSWLSMFVYNKEVYIAYTDKALGDKAVVKKFNGQDWILIGSEGFTEGTAAYLSLFVKDNIPYVAFQHDKTENTCHGSVLRYINGKWESVGKESFTNGIIHDTSVAVDSASNVYFSSDNEFWKYDGTDWVSLASFSGTHTALLVENDVAYVAYSDGQNAGKAHILKYDNTLADLGFVSENSTRYLSLTALNGNIYLAYEDMDSPAIEEGKATVKMYSDGQWSTIRKLLTPGLAEHLSLDGDGNSLYLGFKDGSEPVDRQREGSGKASVMRYNIE